VPRPEGESRSAVIASIVANVAIAITKLVVGGIAGSSAMLAEGVHSLVNCFDGGLLLFGEHRARRAPSATHPFGYGRELYFWALIVALLFFTMGAGVAIYQGIEHLLHPAPIGDPKWSFIVLGVSALFDGGSFVVGYKQFRLHARGRSNWATLHQSKNPVLFSVVLEDVADLSGLVIAFAGVLLGAKFGLHWADGLASILIGCVIATVAVILLIETHGLLLGEAARPQLIDACMTLVRAAPGVRQVKYAGSVHIGPNEVVIAMNVEYDADLPASEVAMRTADLTDRIRREQPDVLRVYLQPTPEA
jgi:cation diffusion facilitator family transporter